MKAIIQNILNDVRVELHDEFTRNFERKAFFNQSWTPTKGYNRRGSMMIRSGALRRGLKARLVGNEVKFSSDVPYAAIQNNGGTIIVTAAMKRFFWAMHYKASGARTKARTQSGSQRNKQLSGEAGYWKALALKKVGSKLVIPQRKFIGSHPSLKPRIDTIVSNHLDEIAKHIKNEITK